MNIGLISDTFPPTTGGMETYAGEFTNALAAHDSVESVSVLAFQSADSYTSDGFDLVRHECNSTIDALKKGIQWVFENPQIEILHSLSLYPAGLVTAIVNWIRPKIRTFVTVHGSDALGCVDDYLRRNIRKFIFRSVNCVFFLSNAVQKAVSEAYKGGFETRQIYPGIPSVPDPKESDVSTDQFTVLYVGRLGPRKHVKDLIEAVKPLQDVDLWIIGDGPRRDTLKNYIDIYELEDRVKLLGFVEDSELGIYYDAADVFCLPSVHFRDQGDIEGLGLVSLEAQSFGLPIIGTDSGGVPETFVPDETGILVDESSPKQIRDAITKFKTNPKLYQQFVKNSREKSSERFSWEACVDAHLETYQDRY